MKITPFREQVLLERCRELSVQLDGQPPHVAAQLRAAVRKEADALQLHELDEHVQIEARYQAKLRKRVARLVTHKAIGRAFFGLPASSPVEMPATPPPTAKEELA